MILDETCQKLMFHDETPEGILHRSTFAKFPPPDKIMQIPLKNPFQFWYVRAAADLSEAPSHVVGVQEHQAHCFL